MTLDYYISVEIRPIQRTLREFAFSSKFKKHTWVDWWQLEVLILIKIDQFCWSLEDTRLDLTNDTQNCRLTRFVEIWINFYPNTPSASNGFEMSKSQLNGEIAILEDLDNLSNFLTLNVQTL